MPGVRLIPILPDINMLGMTGLNSCSKPRHRDRIIMITAYGDDEIMRSAPSQSTS
jgi:CheY-like chemotaxis protein